MGSSSVKLATALAAVRRLYFDSAPLIYYLEKHPSYTVKLADVFRRVDRGDVTGVTSVVTVAEVLVDPLRREDATLAQAYRDLLYHTVFETIAVDAVMAERAAQLRVAHNLKTPDALQLAAAIVSGCGAFLSNDRALLRVTQIDILILDDLDL